MSITNIGTVEGNGATTITVGVAGVPAGVTILVAACSRDTDASANPTMSDTPGNTYVRDIYSDGATELVLFRVSNNLALVQNDTIVFAGGGTGAGQWRAITAWYDDELDLSSPIDQNPATTSGTSTTPVSNNYTTTVANARVYGFAGVSGPGTDGFTQDTDYLSTVTSVGTTGASGGTNKTIRVGNRTLTATETNNYAPTLGTSRFWQAGVIAYKFAAGGNVTGTAAQTLASLQQAAMGAEKFTGTVAQTLAKLAQAAAGSTTSLASGSVAQILPRLAQAAAGAVTGGVAVAADRFVGFIANVGRLMGRGL